MFERLNLNSSWKEYSYLIVLLNPSYLFNNPNNHNRTQIDKIITNFHPNSQLLIIILEYPNL
jgi:hypothetical protein